jgi:hypothetical protein
MFTLLGPQTALDSSGFVVRILSRDTVELVEPDGTRFTATIEFGGVSTVYATSIVRHDLTGKSSPVTATTDANSAAQRIVQGLEAMGGKYEVC